MAREKTRGTAPKSAKDSAGKPTNKAKGGKAQPVKVKPTSIAERQGGGADRYPHRKKEARK